MAVKLQKREKLVVGLGGGCLVLLLIVQFIIFPIIDGKKQYQRRLVSQAKTLSEMQNLQSQYNAIIKNTESSRSKLTKRSKNFTLFSFLDQLAGQTSIKDRIVYMKPSTTIRKNSPYKISLVEMKVQGITMEQLISYLYRVEISKNMVQIKRITISKTDKKKGLVNSILQVETLQL